MAFQMNDMTKPVKDRLGFDPASVKKLTFGELVKKIGPGIILTGIVIGPGNITTSAMMSANYGYKMLWLLIPIILMGITFTLSSYRISIMTGLPILHAIRHYYGGIASGFCGVALFLSCFFFTLGNITGTGAGMNLIFGFDWRIGSLIMLAILAFCYLTKGVYSKVEKGIMICICGMIIAFFATLIATGGPDWGQVGHGLTHPTLPEGSLATALAYISTNAAVTAGIYGTYLGLEKKWNKQDLFNGTMVADAITHIVTVVLISGSIVLVGAIVLHPDGIAIKAPAQLIFIANVATSIATPVAGLFMVLMLWKKELFMGTKAPRVLQVSMTICYIFALYMTVTALKTQIPNLIHSFMG